MDTRLPKSSRRTRIIGYAFGLGAGAIWGTTGPLSTALFEVPFQYAIAGLGVAPAVALLYTAPVTVAIAGHFILREKLTPLRIALAVGVMIGVWLTVNGEACDASQPPASRL